MARILMVLSGADKIRLADGTPHETGFWAEEVYKPLKIFQAAGVEVVVATPGGKAPHADSYGMERKFNYSDEDEDFLASVTRTFADDPEHIRLTLQHLTDQNLIAARRVQDALIACGVGRPAAFDAISEAAKTAWRTGANFVDVAAAHPRIAESLDKATIRGLVDMANAEAQANVDKMRGLFESSPLIRKPRDLASIGDDEAAGFDAVFVPGGHGPMVDLHRNHDMARILAAVNGSRKTIAALCHGPAALLSAGETGADGGWMFDGYKMCAFTDIEEDQTEPGKLGMPWYLESELKNRGAVFDDAPSAWVPHVVVDRNLITAQNPASAEAAAQAVLAAIGVARPQAS